MDSLEDDLDGEDDRVESQLFDLESPSCICCRNGVKSDICSWEHSSEKKSVQRKRGDPANRTQPLLRKVERKAVSLSDGFVFRHYKDTGRYIEQYRENHSSTCAETQVEVKPVLGIDLPDPYLPKIGTTSNGLLERLRIIEAMSDYYRAAAVKSDINNICLTGRRAETAERTTRPAGNKPKAESLPLIKSSSNCSQNTTCLPTKDNNRSNSLTGDLLSGQQGRPSDNLESLSFPFVTEVELPSQSSRKQESREDNLHTNDEARLLSHSQWTESHFPNDKAKCSSVLNSPRKVKLTGDSADCNLAAIGRGQDSPRKSMRREPTQRSPKHKRVQVGKCEVFSSSPRQSKTRRTKANFPSETAFIRILGQSTGPPPRAAQAKDAMKSTSSKGKLVSRNDKVPVHLLGRFGRFHHILEARSFKNADKNVTAAGVANVRAGYY